MLCLIWVTICATGSKLQRQRLQRLSDEGFCNYLYQGQTLDSETGLCYNRFRYYDNESGTYISADPLELESGELNFYAYVDDPNIEIDEFGLYKKAYRKRSAKEVEKLRKKFKNKARAKFLKRLGKDEASLKARRFTDDEIKTIKSGNTPDGYIVHHKKNPLSRRK